MGTAGVSARRRRRLEQGHQRGFLIRARASLSEVAQRWGSILVGAAVIVVVTWMTVEASGPAHGAPRDRRDKDGGASTSLGEANERIAPTPAATSGSAASGRDGGAAAKTDDLDAGLALSAAAFDLDAALSMPPSAPRQVKLGVVLVSYAGAEGAPPNARSKKEAQTIAARLLEDARSDFSHAVSGGDPGSSSDIGRIPRGVLDPRTELSVFALESGAISDVLETPKGYWIVKRLD